MRRSWTTATRIIATATALGAVPLTAAAAPVDRAGAGGGGVLAPVAAVPPGAGPVGPAGPRGGLDPGPVVAHPGPAGPAALQIRDFTISADSVVGTARVRSTGGVRRVTVRWGDGSETSRGPGRPGVGHGPLDDVVLQHRYAPPEDGTAFTRFATASVEGTDGSVDVEVLPVTVTPRFQVTQFRASFRPLEHCDSPAELMTEFTVSQRVDGDHVASWEQEHRTNGAITPGAFQALEGSVVGRQMTAADPPVLVTYGAEETDPVWDDDAGTVSISLHPRFGSRSLRPAPLGDCPVEYQVDVDVRLLAPGLPQGPAADPG